MEHNYQISAKSLVFLRWSRKGYAIFSSLKRVVKIARLSVDTCMASLRKTKSLGSFSTLLGTVFFAEYEFDWDKLKISELLECVLQETALATIETPACIFTETNKTLYIKSPLAAACN